MVSKYFTVRLICKTKFPDTCHALKNSSAVKGLRHLDIIFVKFERREGRFKISFCA